MTKQKLLQDADASYERDAAATAAAEMQPVTRMTEAAAAAMRGRKEAKEEGG